MVCSSVISNWIMINAYTIHADKMGPAVLWCFKLAHLEHCFYILYFHQYANTAHNVVSLFYYRNNEQCISKRSVQRGRYIVNLPLAIQCTINYSSYLQDTVLIQTRVFLHEGCH